MRIKQFWDVVPLPSQLKLAYSLVTLNLPTTIFFLLSLLQCILQSGLHGLSYSHHRSFASQFQAVALNTGIVTQPLAVLSGNVLFLCNQIPQFAGGPGECIDIDMLDQKIPSDLAQSLNMTATSGVMTRAVGDVRPAVLSPAALQCSDVFPWVVQELHKRNREDMIFITYQFWLFCISLIAILVQSVPHLMAALASETLASLATAVRVTATPRFKADFERVVTKGACDGLDLLPRYFSQRQAVEIVICVVNCTALVVLAGLSYRLIQIYGRTSFEKVQRRPDMSRLYIALLSLSSLVHLSTFFVVAGLGIYTDQLVAGPLRHLAQDRAIAFGGQTIIYLLIAPWVILGWTCGRVESKPRIATFIAITVVFLALWAACFVSPTTRFLFLTWDFFAAINIAPVSLIAFILILTIYIWFHLDLGLANYLTSAEPPHPADQVRWSFAAIQDTEKGTSTRSSSVDGPPKPSILWYHSSLPKFISPSPSVATRSLVRSDYSISTGSSTLGDSMDSREPVKSPLTPLGLSSPLEIAMLRKPAPAIFGWSQSPTAQHARPGHPFGDAGVSQGALSR